MNLHLENEIKIQKAKAETWESAYKFLVTSLNNKELTSKKPASTTFSLTELVDQEAKATNFVNDELMPKLDKFLEENPQPTGEFATKGIWLSLAADFIWGLIKEQALIFIAKTLEDLKERGIEWLIEGANWVLNQFQQVLYDKFQAANTEEERTLFKNRILESFPDSQLAKKLQEN